MTRLYTLFFLLIFSSLSAWSQQKQRLNTGWEYLRQDLGGIWEAIRPVGAGNPESVPLWESVNLPHCVNARDAVDPDLNYYQGPAWYRTLLDVRNPYTNGRTLLHFEGAGQKTTVYIYDQKVGEHVGGYDEFTVDITDAITAFQKTSAFEKQFKRRIPLSIRTDNSRDLEMIPSDLSDFNLYGGIYRYLNLVYVPAVSIEQVLASPVTDKDGKTGTLQVRGTLHNPLGKSNHTIDWTLLRPDGKTESKGSIIVNTNDFQFAAPSIRRPERWSPSEPMLYSLRITVANGEQSASDTIPLGFRHFEFAEKGPFYLNGKRLLLRGTHRHEDHAGVAAAMTEDQMRQEMILIKEMGANFIRLGHYQQSRHILDLCDSLGILVWEEIPWCRGGLGGDQYKAQARSMLTNMIHQHFNHPSIILWGLGNENDWPGDFPEFEQAKIRSFMQELHSLSHQIDSSRLTSIRRCDFCKDIVDVYSPSIWAGWYRGVYTEYKEVSEKEMQRVPRFFHAEWGGDSHAGRHAENPDKALQSIRTGGGADERAGDASLFGGAARVSKDGDWSESYICNLMDWHLKEQETMPWLTGSAQWVFKDFSTPVRPDNPVPYMNQKGLVERDFTKKEAYFVFQSYWASKPMLHIYGHSWPVRWGDAGEEKWIKVYSNCTEAELFLNGKSMGKKKRNSQDFPAAGLRWSVVPEAGTNEVRVIGWSGKIRVEDRTVFRYETQKWGHPSRLLAQRLYQSGDTATIQVRLLDNKGVQCLDARNWVYFGLTGDGVLLDNLGTPGGSRKVQLYNGRALIRVHTRGGQSIISVKSDSLRTVFLPIAGPDSIQTVVEETLDSTLLQKATAALSEPAVTVTAQRSTRSSGGIHDFYSEGDYWWPDPANPGGPYIQKDGQTNPDNFTAHRHAMIRFSQLAGSLASGYLLTGKDEYAAALLRHARAWFVDSATRMNPHLLYAQAIQGRATGRGIGIIDAIHLIEVVKGLQAVEASPVIAANDMSSMRAWFSEFLYWLSTHPYGIDEKNAANNHGTCWVMQVVAFAQFTGNDSLVNDCRQRYKKVLLPNQMAADGSFPLELKRTKPYGYSLFNLDAMASICQLLSTPEDNLWNYETADGRSIKKGIEYLFPYVQDKSKWPLPPDVMYWDQWPVAPPFLLFGAKAFDKPEWLETWKKLEHWPQNEEVIRNLPVRNPLIW